MQDTISITLMDAPVVVQALTEARDALVAMTIAKQQWAEEANRLRVECLGLEARLASSTVDQARATEFNRILEKFTDPHSKLTVLKYVGLSKGVVLGPAALRGELA